MIVALPHRPGSQTPHHPLHVDLVRRAHESQRRHALRPAAFRIHRISNGLPASGKLEYRLRGGKFKLLLLALGLLHLFHFVEQRLGVGIRARDGREWEKLHNFASLPHRRPEDVVAAAAAVPGEAVVNGLGNVVAEKEEKCFVYNF